MRLTHLYIEKFRELEEITLPMDQLRVLIGQNGAGKSSILEAIRILGDDNIELTEKFNGARIYELDDDLSGDYLIKETLDKKKGKETFTRSKDTFHLLAALLGSTALKELVTINNSYEAQAHDTRPVDFNTAGVQAIYERYKTLFHCLDDVALRQIHDLNPQAPTKYYEKYFEALDSSSMGIGDDFEWLTEKRIQKSKNAQQQSDEIAEQEHARKLVHETAEKILPLLENCRRIAWTPNQKTDRFTLKTNLYRGLVLKREEIPTDLAKVLTSLAGIYKKTWWYFLSTQVERMNNDPFFAIELENKLFPTMQQTQKELAPITSLIHQWSNNHQFLIVQLGNWTEPLWPNHPQNYIRPIHFGHQKAMAEMMNAIDRSKGSTPANTSYRNPTLKECFTQLANGRSLTGSYGPSALEISIAEGTTETLSKEIEDQITQLHDHTWKSVTKNSSVHATLGPAFPEVFGKVTPYKQRNGKPSSSVELHLSIPAIFDAPERPTKEEQTVMDAHRWLTRQNWHDHENISPADASDLLRARPTIQPVLNLLAHTANNMAPTFLSFAGLITIDVLPPHQWGHGHHIKIQFNNKSLTDLPSGWQRWVAISLRLAQRKLFESSIWLPAIDADLPENYVALVGETRAEQQKEHWGIIHAAAKVIEDPKGHLNFEVEPVTGEQTILLIDEPEVHLHPDAMHNVRNWLTGTLREANISAIVATHSPAFMDYTPEEATLTGVAKTFEGKVETYDCGTDFTTWVNENGEALGIETFDQLLLYRGFILVEGTHDEAVLNHLYATELQNGRIGIINLMGIAGDFSLAESRYLKYTRKPIAMLVDNIPDKITGFRDLTFEQRQLMEFRESFDAENIPFRGWGHTATDIGTALPEDAVRRFLESKKITGTFGDGWAPIEKAVRELRGDGKAKKREVQKLLGLHVTEFGYSFNNFVKPVLEHCYPEDRPSKSLERTMKEIFAWFSSLNENRD